MKSVTKKILIGAGCLVAVAVLLTGAVLSINYVQTSKDFSALSGFADAQAELLEFADTKNPVRL